MSITIVQGNSAKLILDIADIYPSTNIPDGIIVNWIDNWYAIIQYRVYTIPDEYITDGWHAVYIMDSKPDGINEDAMNTVSTVGAVLGNISEALPSISEKINKIGEKTGSILDDLFKKFSTILVLIIILIVIIWLYPYVRK